MHARRKPRHQHSLQETAAASFGPVPFSGPEAPGIWLQFLDLYVKLQHQADRHVGQVLRTLASKPHIAANTVIVFTSDHGEYGASHGLRGKGASAYEESTRVPLTVKDLRGVLTHATRQPRTQAGSSWTTAQAKARSSPACARPCSTPSGMSCARRCRSGCSARTLAGTPTTSRSLA